MFVLDAARVGEFAATFRKQRENLRRHEEQVGQEVTEIRAGKD